jgi:hypothetical protein
VRTGGSEHRKLYLRICRVVDHANEVLGHPPREERVAKVFDEFAEFDNQLRRHESAENELILCEYDDDIGVGD